jgi:hypothetical protein
LGELFALTTVVAILCGVVALCGGREAVIGVVAPLPTVLCFLVLGRTLWINREFFGGEELPPTSRAGRTFRRLRYVLDVWFVLMPILIGVGYWRYFCLLDEQLAVARYLRLGAPGAVSCPTSQLILAVRAYICFVWLLTALLTSYMLWICRIRWKALWCVVVFFFAPIACPACYFAKLRQLCLPPM